MTPATAESTELVVVEKESPLPVYTGAEMVKALGGYRELAAALDRAMPDQIIRLEGRPFRRKGYWRAVAMAFNLVIELVNETRDSSGEDYAYRVTYRAKTQGGRASIGDGTCTAAEKSKGRMRATEHNVRSHAHTRAMNRAISNLVAFGEVSAEEVDEEPAPPKFAKPAPPRVSSTAPAAYEPWLKALTLAADRGEATLRSFWEQADPKLKKYLLAHDEGATWMALKARAVQRSAAPTTAEP